MKKRKRCERNCKNKKAKKETCIKRDKDNLPIHITIYNITNIASEGSRAGTIEQRAEGGGQINRNVGTNANQGGHNAINGSKSFNVKSQFANGNGRSGIAGKGNDEQGGQEAIKIRKQIKKKNE
jgi:hypothetical protein